MREAPLYPFIGPHTGARRAPGTGKPPPRVPAALAAAVLLGFAAPACHGQAPGVLSLRAAVERALANSALLQAAGSAVRVAEQRTREAYGGVYPQVLAETSYLGSLGDRDQPRTGATALDHTVAASLRLNQTVLDVPAFRGLDAAQRHQRLRGEELRGAAHTLVDEVRQRYFDALLSREEERLTAQSISRLQQTLSDTQARHREGFATDDELLRLEVQFANLEAERQRIRQEMNAAHGALLVAMSEDPLQTVALQGDLGALRLAPEETNSPVNTELLAASGAGPLMTAVEEQLRRTALTHRSDLRQLRTLLHLDELQIEIQEAEYLPTIRAFGSLDFNPRWQVSASAGVAMQWQLFGGFARDARIEQRREELGQTAARMRQAELVMLNQVHTLAASLREANGRAATQMRSIEQARKSYEIAVLRFRAGVGAQLDVIAAESVLRQSEFSYARAVYDYLSAASRLEVAVGVVPFADASGAGA